MFKGCQSLNLFFRNKKYKLMNYFISMLCKKKHYEKKLKRDDKIYDLRDIIYLSQRQLEADFYNLLFNILSFNQIYILKNRTDLFFFFSYIVFFLMLNENEKNLESKGYALNV